MKNEKTELFKRVAQIVLRVPQEQMKTPEDKTFVSLVACSFNELTTSGLLLLLDLHAHLTRTSDPEGKVLLQQFNEFLNSYASVPNRTNKPEAL